MFSAPSHSIQRRAFPHWLKYKDANSFSPIAGNWTRVYQTGGLVTETSYGDLHQRFNIQPVIVDLDDIDSLLDADPKSQAPRTIFRGGTPAYSSDRGDYWDEELSKDINGVEARRFLTKLRHDAPKVEHGILSFHDLIERGMRNFYAHETGDHVIKFDTDVWEERERKSGYLNDNVLPMDIQTGYLMDYLDARNAALVLVYFQSRSVRESTDDMEIENEGWEELEIQGYPAKKLPRQLDGLRESYPHSELHWFYPIFPSSSDRSAEGESEANRQIQFRTIEGNSFSPENVDAHLDRS